MESRPLGGQSSFVYNEAMPIEQAAWVAFAGLAFVLMGAGLIADAPVHAQAARDWQERFYFAAGKSRAADPLVWAYRAGGLLFVAAGAWLLAALALSPDLLAARLKAAGGGPLGRLLGGMLFSACGGLLAGARAGEWARGRPRTLSFWSGTALAALFVAFGAFLISRLIQGDAP